MQTFVKNTLCRGDAKGRQWLDSLPHLVKQFAQKWHLTHLKPLENLSYNYVLEAYCDNSTSVILKIGLEPSEIAQEKEALHFYQGHGCVKLLEADVENGALLLETIRPGITLKSLFPQDDTAAVMHAVQVMKQLHTIPLTSFSHFLTLEQHLESLFKAQEKHLGKAQTLARALLNSQAELVLLHTDLHHENILLHETKGWLAIDPRGVIGEPAFEIGTFMYNPIPDLRAQNDVSTLMAQRLKLFVELLQIDIQRLKDWAYVQAMLSACWDIEGNSSNEYSLYCADLIDRLWEN